MILENWELYSNGIFGQVLLQTLLAIFIYYTLFRFLNQFIEPDLQIDKKTENNLLLSVALGSFIGVLFIRLLLEQFSVSTDYFLFLGIIALVFGLAQFNLLKSQTIAESKNPKLKILKLKKYSRPIAFMIISSWLIVLIRFVAKWFGFPIRDKFKWGFLFSFLLISFLAIFISVTNTLIGDKRRIDKYILQKTIIYTSIITYGIWAFQLTFFGLFGAFSGYFLFLPMSYYLFLTIFYVWIFFMAYKRINRSYFELSKSLHLDHMIKENLASRDNESDIILSVKDLKTYFYTEEGVVRAVEGVSFDIKRNEVLGLVGETGCGKSVSALSILRLVRSPGKIEGGQVIFQGQDLLQKSYSEMLKFRGKDITMIFQDPINSVNPVYKAGDQIAEVYLLHKKKELFQVLMDYKPKIKAKEEKIARLSEKLKNAENNEKTNSQLKNDINKAQTELEGLKKYSSIYTIAREWSIDLLRNVGIPAPEKIYDRYPHELSGGMRQRIMIAMGLACSPKLLIADEPTTALDVTVQMQILDLMKQLKHEYKTSFLYITHDLGVISRICDKVAVMYSGYIVESADVKTLFTLPLHPYTFGLISAIPNVDRKKAKLPIIPGMVPNLIHPPSGCRFHPRCKYCFDKCPQSIPEAYPVGKDHKVACFLYDPKLKDQTREARKELEERRKKMENIQGVDV